MAEHRIARARLIEGGLTLKDLRSGEKHRVVVEPDSFELHLFDGKGMPVPDMPVTFVQGTRNTSVPTDAAGLALFRTSHLEDVLARIDDCDSARQTLSRLWSAHGRDEGLAGQGYEIMTLQDLASGLATDAGRPLRVALPPRSIRVRLIGMHFETSKCFLLPAAMRGIRRLCRLYDEHPEARVLVVGHTDTKDSQARNALLSLERAESVAAFLGDRVDDWLVWYEYDKTDAKRWGTREDQHMLSALPTPEKPYFAGQPNGVIDAATTAAVKSFQSAEGLEVDGIAGPKTRRALVQRYMALDGTTLPAGCEVVTHGCGELFPSEDLGDEQRSEENRRVEVFLFDGHIVPPPPDNVSAAGSTEYPAWLAQTAETMDVSGEVGLVTFSVKLADSEFRAEPYATKRFELTAEDDVYSGVTSADGTIVQTIPETATTVHIKLWLNAPGEEEVVKEWTLRVVRELPPATTLRGVLSRLHNLGYYDKDLGTSFGDDERFAVRWFQVDHALADNGNWTDARTRDLLVQKHGC